MPPCEPYTEDNRRTVYLAAPLFNDHQRYVIEQITGVMEEVGVNVFSPLEESKPLWNGRPPSEATPEVRRAVMQMNKNGIEGADLVFAWLGGWAPWRTVADEQRQFMDTNPVKFSNERLQKLIPSLPDTGVVWELGYANAIGIPTLAYLHSGEENRHFNLMLSETVDATARGLDELREQLLAFKEVPTGGELADAMVGALATEGEEFNG